MISWSLDTLYFHHIHSKIQSEITCTHNYPQFSPSWCPSAAGSSWPPPPWSPPWQSPPCPALSLLSTPSSSQPWCSQQAPNPSVQNYFCGGSLYSLTSHFSVGLLPYFSISAIWSSSSLRKNKSLLHSTKTFRLKTWGRLLFPQGWLALCPERVVFFGGKDKQIFTGNLFFGERNKSVVWQNLILDKDGENGHFLKTCHLDEEIKKKMILQLSLSGRDMRKYFYKS